MIMKKLYSAIMLLAMMVAALCFTACGDDDDEDGGNGNFDDSEYFQVTINGETYNDDSFGGALMANFEPKEKNGTKVYAYGGLSDGFHLSYQDDVQFAVMAGYTTRDMEVVYPKSTGSYEVVSDRGQYWFDEYSDRVGMFVSGGNMNHRTVTSGSLKITKTSKYRDSSPISITDREEMYITEGTFSFVLTDDWDGNENKISGKFRLVF